MGTYFGERFTYCQFPSDVRSLFQLHSATGEVDTDIFIDEWIPAIQIGASFVCDRELMRITRIIDQRPRRMQVMRGMSGTLSSIHAAGAMCRVQ
jgi:hypothetical protein